MKRILPLAATLLCLPLGAPEDSSRPRISGIDHVRIYARSVSQSRAFYGGILGFPARPCAGPARACFAVGARTHAQQLELEEAPATPPANLLAEVAFATDDVPRMRRYLLAHGLDPGRISTDAAGARQFELRDPEGNPIAFVERPGPASGAPAPNQVSARVVHAGFVVRDRAAEDRFYKDMLGFRVYWHGGMNDLETSWMDMQVTDGTDWLEYMLNISPDAPHRTLGVMNHIALGVPDIRAAREQLAKNGWKPGEEPKIGRDGKWQLNLFDPDETRVEIMEFTPAGRTCCTEFTGPHPGPAN